MANGSNVAALRSESSQANDVDDAAGSVHPAHNEIIGTLEHSKSLPQTASKEERLRAFARTPTSKLFDRQFERRYQERLLKGHFGVTKTSAPVTNRRSEEASTDVPRDKYDGKAPALVLEMIDHPPRLAPTDVPQTTSTSQESHTLEEIINMARHASQLVTERESRSGNIPYKRACSQSRANRDDLPIRSNCRVQQ